MILSNFLICLQSKDSSEDGPSSNQATESSDIMYFLPPDTAAKTVFTSDFQVILAGYRWRNVNKELRHLRCINHLLNDSDDL